MKTHLVFAATLITSITMQAQKLERQKQIPIRGSFTNPIVSPDGNYALLTKDHFNGVYLLDLKTKKVTEVSDAEGSGYAYSWNTDSKTFYFKEKEPKGYVVDSKIRSYTINTKQLNIFNELKPNYIPSFKVTGTKNESKILIYTNLTSLKIEAKDLKTQKNWVITNDEGQFYNAILSHDGKKIAVHKGTDIYVYDADGKSKGVKIGSGIATSWSENDKYLIGFLDESKDGHSITNSDLYLFDVTTSKTIKLTSTKDITEMFPCFYGDNKVMFSDDKTGKIYVSELKI